MVVHKCTSCEFSTVIKQHYDRHLLSKKHISCQKLALVSQKLGEISQKGEIISQPLVALFACKYCDKKYKHKPSLSKHIKYSCTKSKDEDLKELVRLMNSQLEQQRNEIHQQNSRIETQSKQIERLMSKLEINYNNNINNTINIQNITLLNYKDTDVSHLTKDDYKKCIKKVCFCVMSLIEKIHFNPNKPENMNIYISNMKDKYVMVYEDGNWILKNKNLLDRLYDDKELMIEEWIEENKDKEMEQFFTKYLKNKKDPSTIEMINDEIKLMMYNKKNMIQCE